MSDLERFFDEEHGLLDRQLALNVTSFQMDAKHYAVGYAYMLRFMYEKKLLAEYEEWLEKKERYPNDPRPNPSA